jgi:hypothetical protein
LWANPSNRPCWMSSMFCRHLFHGDILFAFLSRLCTRTGTHGYPLHYMLLITGNLGIKMAVPSRRRAMSSPPKSRPPRLDLRCSTTAAARQGIHPFHGAQLCLRKEQHRVCSAGFDKEHPVKPGGEGLFLSAVAPSEVPNSAQLRLLHAQQPFL